MAFFALQPTGAWHDRPADHPVGEPVEVAVRECVRANAREAWRGFRCVGRLPASSGPFRSGGNIFGVQSTAGPAGRWRARPALGPCPRRHRLHPGQHPLGGPKAPKAGHRPSQALHAPVVLLDLVISQRSRRCQLKRHSFRSRFVSRSAPGQLFSRSVTTVRGWRVFSRSRVRRKRPCRCDTVAFRKMRVNRGQRRTGRPSLPTHGRATTAQGEISTGTVVRASR
jgi:hypothetical protein